ncbi:MAG TPA: hypothetical protein VE662_05515 [Solirubrobacterales bacterium]|nr:hypothetical protein [Solirubrobacterales bacterium]
MKTQQATGVQVRAEPLWRRSEPALVLALALVSCTAGPLPRLPQVEQATEAVQGGGERYRAHRACSGQTSSVDNLIGCMRDAGWDFVARAPGYPEADCWQARDRGEVDRIQAQCFVRSPEARRKLTP